MDGHEPHDFMSKEELDKRDEWLGWQAWTLAAGLACGLIANLLVRHRQVGGGALPGGGVAEDLSGAMGAAASRVASLGAVSTSNKMVLVVRTDLGMGKGKACAQCAHAAVECYRKASAHSPRLVRQWEVFGQKKVALKAQGSKDKTAEEELEELRKSAEEAGLTTALIHDAGETQLQSGTATVLGVGPGPEKIVDKVTGHLKLF